MLLVTTQMNAIPKKQKELTQTLRALAGQVRKEPGCVSCCFCLDLEKDNALCLFEEWETRKDFVNHLWSENFSVLRGAVKFLSGLAEMELMTYSNSHIMGAKAIESARERRSNVRPTSQKDGE